MTAMNLPDFLLARIAEDEADAPRWHDIECDLPIAGLEDLRMAAVVPGAVCDCGGPARVLAECDAKRRIIEWLPERTVLRLLALPYVNHPHYDEEWRL